jgi:hypothetical protein
VTIALLAADVALSYLTLRPRAGTGAAGVAAPVADDASQTRVAGTEVLADLD